MERMLEATAAAENDHYWFRGLRRQARILLEAALDGSRPARVLDAGAGTGRNLDWLGDYGHAVGVERHPTGLAVGRAHGRPLIRGSVTSLPIATGSVDLVTSFDVLYCLPDTDETAALAEMRRVLRPGGRLICNVAALDQLRGSHSTLTGEVRRYTPARLRRRLVDAGFVVDRITFTNMTLFPLALGVRTLERIAGRAGEASDADLRIPVAPINVLLDLALQAEALWLRVGNLPIGTSVMAVAHVPRAGARPGGA